MCRAFLLIDEEAPDDELLANKADYVGQEGIFPSSSSQMQCRQIGFAGVAPRFAPPHATDWDNTKRR